VYRKVITVRSGTRKDWHFNLNRRAAEDVKRENAPGVMGTGIYPQKGTTEGTHRNVKKTQQKLE